MARGRKTVYATIILVLAVVELPFSAFAVASVSSMFPMHTCPEPCEAGMSCMGSCPMLVQVNSRSGQKSLPRSSPGKSSPYPCSSASQLNVQRISIEGMTGPRMAGSRVSEEFIRITYSITRSGRQFMISSWQTRELI